MARRGLSDVEHFREVDGTPAFIVDVLRSHLYLAISYLRQTLAYLKLGQDCYLSYRLQFSIP